MRALSNYRKRISVLDNPPTHIWIEPTNHCNLRCIMCPNGAGMVNIQKGYMDYGLYRRIIDEIKDHTSSVTLALGGESLLHPRFPDMIEYANSSGIKTLLNTNATLLGTEMAHRLLDCGIANISFAFDGFDKGTYEKNRVGADFEKTLENILYFLELRKKRRKRAPYCVLSILKLGVEDCDKGVREDFVRRFDGLIDEIRLREVSSWGSAFKESDKFSHKRYEFQWTPCSRLWSTICIAWNGEVLPCVYNANHEYTLGDMKKERLLDIWNGQRMVRLREAMIDGSYLKMSPLCANCIVLGTPPIMGIPSGIRLTLADAVTNILGYRFERMAIRLANKLRKGDFASTTIG